LSEYPLDNVTVLCTLLAAEEGVTQTEEKGKKRHHKTLSAVSSVVPSTFSLLYGDSLLARQVQGLPTTCYMKPLIPSEVSETGFDVVLNPNYDAIQVSVTNITPTLLVPGTSRKNSHTTTIGIAKPMATGSRGSGPSVVNSTTGGM
jgi:hypothetical protein